MVKINARGTIIEEERSILTQVKDSAMEAMFSGRHYVEEKDGAVVLDKDPTILKHILSLLKKIELNLSDSFKILVDIELEFWGLPPIDHFE